MSQKQTNIIELANNFFADSVKNYSDKSILRYKLSTPKNSKHK